MCVACFGEDVAVFFAGIGWFDAHEEERRSALSFDLGEEVCDRTEIVGGDVGVSGANGDGFCERYAAYFVEIGRDEGNSGEGIASARLNGDAHVCAELAAYERNLRAGGCDGDGNAGGRLAYLAADALDHGFARAVCAAQETQKLFGI